MPTPGPITKENLLLFLIYVIWSCRTVSLINNVLTKVSDIFITVSHLFKEFFKATTKLSQTESFPGL